jgi:hypothetical protein
MGYGTCRPLGRLCCWLMVAVVAAFGANGSPVTTTVSDSVYLADGTAARGNLIITWPAFVTSDGVAVAAGSTYATLGANGALSVALVPNAGASPAGVYYTVTYQLGPGQVKTEYWVVPGSSPAKLATVRTTPGSGLAAQPVSAQYVNSALATKADDSAVVHIGGAEIISGAKTFAASPSVPAPSKAGDIANKSYVDSSLANVGAGNYLPTAGGTMAGPITLPGNAASLLAPATVLFDDVIANAPGFCTYALVNAASMQCSITSTYGTHISLAEVRTAVPDSNYETVLVESLADGGQCYIASSASLDFYPQYVPPLNQLIVASYRGYGRAVAQVVDADAIGRLRTDRDDGIRAIVRTLKSPGARTQADCENAALALLDDAGAAAWGGTYRIWSDFLPGGAGEIFPGDAVDVKLASGNAEFVAVVRAVEIEYRDPANDRGMYIIEFGNDAAATISLETEMSGTAVPLQDVPARLAKTEVGNYYLSSLTDAQITQVSSTTVQVDAGMSPGGGLGIEVRTRDYGWGPGSDRNLLGRFTTRSFTLPRLGRTQTYFLRLYDGSTPTRYSRYAAALHVDCPLGYTL